jgi:O-acetyl-ADP-ribose deacetylase (regulator of RNase III)
MFYQEIKGDLIKLALQGKFDVIAHGCNTFCSMGAGIAPQMAAAFGADEFDLEQRQIPTFYNDEDEEWVMKDSGYVGDINKLGQIDYKKKYLWFNHPMAKDGLAVAMNHKTKGQANVGEVTVVNAYTQYGFGRNHVGGKMAPIDYEALTMCMRKMNHVFKGKHIGLPQIGAGLAGGDWNRIKNIIQTELTDCKVTVVIYQP